MRIVSIEDCGIRQFVETTIKMYGVPNTKNMILEVMKRYANGQSLGMKAQKEGLDELSFVLMLLFNWVLCTDHLIKAVDLLVDIVADKMDKAEIDEVCEPAEVIHVVEYKEDKFCVRCRHDISNGESDILHCDTCDEQGSNFELFDPIKDLANRQDIKTLTYTETESGVRCFCELKNGATYSVEGVDKEDAAACVLEEVKSEDQGDVTSDCV